MPPKKQPDKGKSGGGAKSGAGKSGGDAKGLFTFCLRFHEDYP